MTVRQLFLTTISHYTKSIGLEGDKAAELKAMVRGVGRNEVKQRLCKTRNTKYDNF